MLVEFAAEKECEEPDDEQRHHGDLDGEAGLYRPHIASDGPSMK
jgi:hypothetical protein